MRVIPISSWTAFIELIDALGGGDFRSTKFAFRGHANMDWELQPTFLRAIATKDLSEEKALALEGEALAEFRAHAHLHLSPDECRSINSELGAWTVMQHHGAPTRLLDWTTSIYVAAYFAVTDEFNEDGSITVVHINTLIQQMSNVHKEFRFKDLSSSKLLFQTDAPKILGFIGSTRKSRRIIAQQGIFSVCKNILCDHGEVLSDISKNTPEEYFYMKLLIPNDQKRIFLSKLRAMNITSGTLFPDIDGLGRSITELIYSSP